MLDFADITPAYVQVLHVTAPLIALVVLGILARGVPRVLLLVQSVYWFLAFVPRPLLLLATTPTPSFGDDLADPRLASTGYDYNIAHVLEPLATGLWIYVGLVALFVVWQRSGSGRSMSLQEQSPTIVLTFVAAWLLGGLARLFALATGQMNKAGEVAAGSPYLTFITDTSAVGAIGIIVFLRLSSARLTVAVLACTVAGELLWGIAEESKTPFLGAVLALVLRLSAAKMTRRKSIGVVGLGVIVMAMFSWLQSFKQDAASTQATANADIAYPEAVRPLLSMVRRFDLFAAATDSYFLDGRHYLGIGEVFTRTLLNCIPQQLGVQKIASGTDWATRVRGSSVDMTSIQVSLAEGHFNEGYAVDGYLGVFAESIFVLGIVLLVARFLASRSIPLLTIGLVFVSLPALLERGALGISETLGKGLQQAVVISAIAGVVWLIRGLKAGPPSESQEFAMDESVPARKVMT